MKSIDICGHLCQKITVLYEKKAITKTNNNVPICCIKGTVSFKSKDLTPAQMCLCSKYFVISIQILTSKYSCPFKNIYSLFVPFLCFAILSACLQSTCQAWSVTWRSTSDMMPWNFQCLARVWDKSWSKQGAVNLLSWQTWTGTN